MNQLKEKFNELSNEFDNKEKKTEEDVWTLLFGCQVLIFDALIILFNEIQVIKEE